MCGRFSLFTPAPVLALAGLFDLTGFPELAPRYNIAPTQAVLAVRAACTGREAALLRWGLVAPWAKDMSASCQREGRHLLALAGPLQQLLD